MYNDLEFDKVIKASDLSQESIRVYTNTIKQFSEIINKPYSVFVDEIKKTQKNKINFETGEIDEYNPNDSKINEYITNYLTYLQTVKGNKQSTINNKLTTLFSIFRKSGLKTPKIVLKKEGSQKRVPLLTKKDISFVLQNSNIYHQAIITFMASTSFRRFDVCNFKISDFIEATSEYHDEIFLEDFLKKAPQNMIGVWDFIPHKTKKTQLPCKNCNSAESSNLILESLKARINSINVHNKRYGTDLELTEDDSLFGSKINNYVDGIKPQSLSVVFQRKNSIFQKYKKEELKNKLINKEITKSEYNKRINNLPVFKPHALRHFCISTIRLHTSNISLSLLMEGHASSISTDKFYIGESDELFDKQTIKEEYIRIMPYLTFQQKIDPVEYSRLLQQKEENENLKKKIDSIESKFDEFEKMKIYLRNNSVLNDIKEGF